MNRQLSEEQLDSLMRTIVSDAAADEGTVNELADSPSLWWGISRQINEGKEAGRSPWPPIAKYWRLLLVGVPVAAAAVLVISFFVMLPAVPVEDKANNSVPSQTASVAAAPVIDVNNDVPAAVNSNANGEPEIRTNAVKTKFVTTAKKRVRATTAAVKRAEVKTEFIALSYGRSPESGQIVRVKVPSSMMVTLGLVSAVQRPTSMIDAEVVVGDDGMTHAIRFIR